MLPNVLTVARILAVPPLVWLLLEGIYDWALAVAVAAGITDLADGWLARRFGWQSRFGGFADPLADKLLMLSSFLTLAWLGELVWWLVAVVILRDAVIVAGGLAYHLVFEPVTAEPTRMSKFNTFCQILLVWLVLLRLAGVPVAAWLMAAAAGLVVAMALVTLTQYVWMWSLKAVRISRARQ